MFHLDDDFGGPTDGRFQWGRTGSGWIPLVGDWGGGGVDAVGFYQPDNSSFHLTNETGGPTDAWFQWDPSGGVPLVVHWNGPMPSRRTVAAAPSPHQP